jgi:transcriptional regulator with XRE-family HTH domain
MATALAPVNAREVVRCDHCQLVQFPTIQNLCRRCHRDYDEPVAAAAGRAPVNGNGNGDGNGHQRFDLSASIRTLRLRIGLSQRELALRMSVPRTYVSKLENQYVVPTLSSLVRLADALEVNVPELLTGVEDKRQEDVRELMEDKFVAEIVPFVARLDMVQRSSILAQIRDLMEQRRRSRCVR